MWYSIKNLKFIRSKSVCLSILFIFPFRLALNTTISHRSVVFIKLQKYFSSFAALELAIRCVIGSIEFNLFLFSHRDKMIINIEQVHDASSHCNQHHNDNELIICRSIECIRFEETQIRKISMHFLLATMHKNEFWKKQKEETHTIWSYQRQWHSLFQSILVWSKICR